MQPFSDEYNRCMQTALNYYPDDEAVNLNLANVALSQHDLLKAETLLEQVPEDCDEYAEAYRLLKFLKYFKPIPETQIPPTSLLREFLGGSSFEY